MSVADDDRPSRAALKAWLGSKPERTQKRLAEACGVGQQTISKLVVEKGSEAPRDWLADLIHLATRGAVPRDGWKTRAEREAEERARERARQGVRVA